MSNINYSLNMQAQDANGTKSLNVTSNDPGEIQRLMALAGILDGTHEQQAAIAVQGPSVHVHQDDDHMDSDAVCADCGNAVDQCECDESDYCGGCGAPIEHCTCDDPDHEDMMPAQSFAVRVIPPMMEGQADFDHGQVVITDEGEEVDPDLYMWKPTAGEQKIVKGGMGDNPLIAEAAAKIAQRMLEDYKSFLGEADDSDDHGKNQDGQLSPLSMADRVNFDKDPTAKEEPVTDGTRSPMSRISRQQVAK
jgi:hypothetical protein